jgi:parallel beta-helix repeat protein
VHLGADALLRKNTVTRAGTSGIVVAGSGTAAKLEGNIVSNASETGITVESAAAATIDKGNFISGGKWGISILSSGTNAEVRGNRVRNVTNQGISVLYGAQATVDSNTVEGGDSGIYVRYPDSRAVITGNFVSAEDEGIYVWEGATAERIADNTVSGGVRAILISDAGSSAEIAGNEVIGGMWGIAVVYGAQATLVENQITGSASGIYLRGGGTIATVTGNTVSDSVSNGIYIFDRVTAEHIAENIVTGGVTGILVARVDTAAVIEANNISGASHEGIALRSGASAEIRRNHVEKIGGPVSGSGISVTGSHTTATVEENTLTDIRGTGILFNQGAEGSISGNILTAVANTGIRIIDADTKVTVTGNAVRDARAIGIEARAGEFTIADNTVVNASQVGIQLGPDAVAEVRGNTITGPGEQDVDHDGPYGIQVLRGARGAITGNWIANHRNVNREGTACGIIIDAETPKIVVTENLFPEPGNEVNMCDERPRLPAAARASAAATAAATPAVATPVVAASPVAAASPEATPVPTATRVATPVVTATPLPVATTIPASTPALEAGSPSPATRGAVVSPSRFNRKGWVYRPGSTCFRGSCRLRLQLDPAAPGRQLVVVHLTDPQGSLLALDAAPTIEVAWTLLAGESDRADASVFSTVLKPDAGRSSAGPAQEVPLGTGASFTCPSPTSEACSR